MRDLIEALALTELGCLALLGAVALAKWCHGLVPHAEMDPDREPIHDEVL